MGLFRQDETAAAASAFPVSRETPGFAGGYFLPRGVSAGGTPSRRFRTSRRFWAGGAPAQTGSLPPPGQAGLHPVPPVGVVPGLVADAQPRQGRALLCCQRSARLWMPKPRQGRALLCCQQGGARRLPQAAPVSSMAESMGPLGEEHLPGFFKAAGRSWGPGDGGALPKAGEGFLHLGGKLPHPRQGAQVPPPAGSWPAGSARPLGEDAFPPPPESSWPSWPSSSSTWRWAWGESSSRGWQGGQVSAMCSAARREPTWVELRALPPRPGDAKRSRRPPRPRTGRARCSASGRPPPGRRCCAGRTRASLQGLLPQVDAVGGVQLDGIGIHVGQPLDGRGLAGPMSAPGIPRPRGRGRQKPCSQPTGDSGRKSRKHPAAQGGFPRWTSKSTKEGALHLFGCQRATGSPLRNTSSQCPLGPPRLPPGTPGSRPSPSTEMYRGSTCW